MYLYDAAAVARLREHGILARSTEFAKLRGRPVGMPARLTAAQALGAHALGLLDGSSADQVFEAADWARAAAVVALVDRGYAVSDGVRFGADLACYRGPRRRRRRRLRRCFRKGRSPRGRLATHAR